MIAVDTNVLVRLFVPDDEVQCRKSADFFAERTTEDPAFVNLVVLFEFAWVLAKVYGYKREQVLDAVGYLLETGNMDLQCRAAVADAAQLAARAKVDFEDALIGMVNRESGCAATITFDQSAATIPGMELLS